MRSRHAASGSLSAVIAVFLSVLVSEASSARGGTLRVPGDFASIQEALDAASSGDTVVVGPGVWELERPLRFTPEGAAEPKDLTLVSEAGALATVLRRSAASADPDDASVLVFDGGESTASVVEGLTVTGGRQLDDEIDTSSVGGGVRVARGSGVTLRACRIVENTAAQGGGLACEEATVVLEDCEIAGNVAERCCGGGILCDRSELTILRCDIVGNTANASCIDGTCVAAVGGGIEIREGSAVTMIGGRVSRNSSDSQGGGIHVASRDVELRLEGVELRGNFAVRGGALAGCCNGDVQLSGCVLVANVASFAGALDGTARLEQCTVVGNTGGALSGGDLSRTIVWANSGSLAETVRAERSIIEADEVWPGDGNSREDPLFCGWGEVDEVWVADESFGRHEERDGSDGAPFLTLEPALEFDLRIAAASPALADGTEAGRIGADTGVCETPGARQRTIHVAAGEYEVDRLSCAFGVSIEGVDAEATRLQGSVVGLRTGARLSGVTVERGRWLGGVRLDGHESPRLVDCRFRSNLAADEPGGGVHCGAGSEAEILGCSFEGNSSSAGGGLFCSNDSIVLVERCAFIGNTANAQGAAIYCERDASVTVRTSLVVGHFPIENTTASGSALLCGRGASMTLEGCTITGNSSIDRDSGVLLFERDSAGVISDSIVFNPRTSILAARPEAFPAISWSAVRSDSGPIAGEGNLDVAPDFVDGGRFSFQRYELVRVGAFEYRLPLFIREPGDYRLVAGSELIDAGSPTGSGVLDGVLDLAGSPRVCAERVDMGAFEACDPKPVAGGFIRGDVDGGGSREITDAVLVLRHLFQGGEEPSCLDAADVDDDGSVECSDAIVLLSHLFLFADVSERAPWLGCGGDPTPDAVPCDTPPAVCDGGA